MEDPITSNSGIQSRHSLISPLVGKVTLIAVFALAASLTWGYLASASSQAASTVAAASVSMAKPSQIDTSAYESVSLSAKSAIVVDETTGQVLFALHPDVQWPLASLTKVALVLSVGEALPGDTVVTIPFGSGYNSHAGGSLKTGERWKLQDVIDFTLAVSSNQGADMLAEIANAPIHNAYPLSPPVGATLWRMNNLAQSLHLTHTYFLNDNGLDMSTTQSGAYGSASDIASLLAYAVQVMPDRFSATTKTSFTVTSIDGTRVNALNTDEALPVLPNVILGKTGYTDLAGGNLAICFRDNGHTICAVVLGSTFDGRFADMKQLAIATQRALALR